MKFKQLGLVGCGLMGASFALALQEKQLVFTITGFRGGFARARWPQTVL
jgi:prephenate dehydrogenase